MHFVFVAHICVCLCIVHDCSCLAFNFQSLLVQPEKPTQLCFGTAFHLFANILVKEHVLYLGVEILDHC